MSREFFSSVPRHHEGRIYKYFPPVTRQTTRQRRSFPVGPATKPQTPGKSVWLNSAHGVALVDGSKLTKELVRRIIDFFGLT